MHSPQALSPKLIAHASTEDYLLASWDHSVYRLEHGGHRPQKIFDLPPTSQGLAGRLKHVLARSRLRQWLRPHLGIDHLIQAANGTIVIVYDRVYLFKEGQDGRWATPCNSANVGPFCGPLRGGMTTHPASGAVYFGEYINDGTTPSVRVIRVDTVQRKLEVVWTFSRAEMRHIHGLQYDPYRQRIWITTGDKDHESTIYYTDDEFGSVQKLGGGDQTWRAISLLPFPEHIEWGMDAGKDAPASAINKVFRYALSSGEREDIAVIGNPAYAAARCADGAWVMATTYEPGRQQETPEAAGLWWRSTDGEWRQVVSMDYEDSGMPTVSRYGLLYLPYGVLPANTAIFTAINCRDGHLKTYSLALS